MAKFRCKSGLPKVTFSQFIERFTLLGGIPNEVFVLSYVFLERVKKAAGGLEPLCLHKLFSMCLYLGHKYGVDYEVWFLQDWAKLSGMELREVEQLEVLLVKELLGFEVFVKEMEFLKAERVLVEAGVGC
jgi:hypothetical protein